MQVVILFSGEGLLTRFLLLSVDLFYIQSRTRDQLM